MNDNLDKDINDNVIKIATIKKEQEIRRLLENTHYKVALSSLGNVLVRKCLELGVDKGHFLAQMCDAWDYHSHNEE